VAVAMAAPPAPAASPVVAPAPAPAPKPASAVAAASPAPAVEEPSLIGSLLDDPMALGGGALVLALLGGFGAYRYMKRGRKDSGETSFLESRLQPDSFFGVSGGQHIDTREGPASGAPSSMSYSLSQLDAIGDVDPVAEADVYLAYGRDLQAEEILKEAMRGAPDRMAIRTKLLEVYAKRRDAKGFEALALQLYHLTSGAGEDWAPAQELGQQIDPDNPLYKPGGEPGALPDGSDRPVKPLGASTMPQSVLPSPSQFERMAASTAVMPAAGSPELDLDLDLDLDLPAPAGARAPAMPEVTQPMAPPDASPAAADERMSLDLPIDAPTMPESAAPAPAERDLSMDFDLSGISLDLNTPAPAAAPQSVAGAAESLDLPEIGDGSADPFERKLELAEEFRQIGDLDGARDLLNEVIEQTGGAIQAKARSMLDRLS
jgi:pilus assembly protein FimV